MAVYWALMCTLIYQLNWASFPLNKSWKLENLKVELWCQTSAELWVEIAPEQEVQTGEKFLKTKDMTDQFHGKVALVTGASSGIGKAIAEELLRNNLKVVGVARRLDVLLEMEKANTNFTPFKVGW